MSEIVPCLACGTDFEREYRTRHFCDTHQIVEERRKDAIYRAEQDEIERHAKKYALEEFERITARTPYDMSLADAEDFLDAIGYEDGDDIPLSRDDKPRGWLSRRGPEQGASTYFKSLDEYIYGWDGMHGIHAEAYEHPWWDDNPHWTYDLDEGMPAVARMKAWAAAPVGCGEAQGTRAGYARHLRAGESACEDCLSAQAAYFREYRNTA